jgi:hypothetical protein
MIWLRIPLFANATTIEDILAHTFFENYDRFDSEDFDGCVGQAELISFLRRHPRMKAVSSHQFRFPVPQEPGFLFFDLCFLRDPIDRIRSMYDYFLEKPIPGEPASDLARDQPVEDSFEGGGRAFLSAQQRAGEHAGERNRQRSASGSRPRS